MLAPRQSADEARSDLAARIAAGGVALLPRHLELILVGGPAESPSYLPGDTVVELVGRLAADRVATVTLSATDGHSPLDHPAIAAILGAAESREVAVELVVGVGRPSPTLVAEARRTAERVVLRVPAAATGSPGLQAALSIWRGSRLTVELIADWTGAWHLAAAARRALEGGAEEVEITVPAPPAGVRALDAGHLDPEAGSPAAADPRPWIPIHETDLDTLTPVLSALAQGVAGTDRRVRIAAPWASWTPVLSAHGLGGGEPPPSGASRSCVFPWLTATVSAAGTLYPCPKLASSDHPPLATAPLSPGWWLDAPLSRLRQEMRELFVARGRIHWRRRRFDRVARRCCAPEACELKLRPYTRDPHLAASLERALSAAEATRRDGAVHRWLEIQAFRLWHGSRVRLAPLAARVRLWRRRRLASRDVSGRLLHIGCGPRHLPGWVNVDLQDLPTVDLVADATAPLGFREVRAVWAEHFIEHLDPEAALRFLVEVHRALAADGWLRLSTPNLAWVVATHYPAAAGGPARAVDALGINRAFRGWRHRLLWDRELLARALAACGFTDLRWLRHGEAGVSLFRGVDRHPPDPDLGDIGHVLVVEARKGEPQPGGLRELRDLLERELGRYCNAVG